MRKLWILFCAAALAGCYATVEDGRRGGSVFSLRLPEVLPPLVVVQPGVSVVRDSDEEVFYSDGYYWARQDNSWYRSHDHRGEWSRVETREVPSSFANSPPGRYRHYRGDEQQRGEEHGRRDDDHGHHEGNDGDHDRH